MKSLIVILLFIQSFVCIALYSDTDDSLIDTEFEERQEKGYDYISEEYDELKAAVDSLMNIYESLSQVELTLIDSLGVFSSKLSAVEKDVVYIASDFNNLNDTVHQNRLKNDILTDRLTVLSDSLVALSNNIYHDIEIMNQSSRLEINHLKDEIVRSRLHAIIAFLGIILLIFLIYITSLRKKLTGREELLRELNQVKVGLQEEVISAENKVVELLEKQLELLSIYDDILEQVEKQKKSDHSLALVIANEITRLDYYLSSSF